MLLGKETNSIPKQSSTFMETLQNKLKDVKNFSNWFAKEQMVAVGAVGVIFGAALPILAIALPVAAAGAIVALTLFFAVKAVEYTFKGLKWSAEKTVKGAKYTAGKIKDGAVHAKDKIKSGASHTVHNLSQSLDRLSSQTNYSETMLNSQLLADDARDKIVSIKERFMNIFHDEKIANKDKLLEKILRDIVLQIESKKERAQGTDSMKYACEWAKQINFINDLNAEKLHDLLTKQSSPKNTYFLYTIFSEHHDKIERIVEQCKTEHKLSNVVEKLNGVAKTNATSAKGLTEQLINNSSRSSLLDSVRADSTVSSEVELLNSANRKEVKQSSGFFSRFKRNETPKEATDIEYQALSDPNTVPNAEIGSSRFYADTPTPTQSTVQPATIGGRPGVVRRNSTGNLTRVETPEVPALTCSSSFDSGRGSSGPSTPGKGNLPSKAEFDKELAGKLAKRRASLDQPSAEPVNSRATAIPGAV